MVLDRIEAQKVAQAQKMADAQLGIAQSRLGMDQTRQQQQREEFEFEKEQAGIPRPVAPVSMSPGSTLVDPSSGRLIVSIPDRPEKPEKPPTKRPPSRVGPGERLVDEETGRVIYTAPSKPEKQETQAQSAYGAERARRTIQAVDELLPKVGPLTAGLGALTRGVYSTPARAFASQLKTLTSNIAFNELTEMRAASKSGGALGAVSDKEGELLQSVLGGLDQGQSPDELRGQLNKVKESLQRWEEAKAKYGGGARAAPSADGAAVEMVAPDGRRLRVPAERVSELEAKGARRTR